MESAWDSVGRRKPPNQSQPKVQPAARGAVGGAGAWDAEKLQGVREPGEGGESPRGAEASLDMPHRGDNVSSVIAMATWIMALFIYL